MRKLVANKFFRSHESLACTWQQLRAYYANAVILDNTFQLSKVLKGLMEEGWTITRDELALLSLYQTHHIKRLGNYVMDIETLPQPIEDDLPQ